MRTFQVQKRIISSCDDLCSEANTKLETLSALTSLYRVGLNKKGVDLSQQ
jgi:hypothetical protein